MLPGCELGCLPMASTRCRIVAPEGPAYKKENQMGQFSTASALAITKEAITAALGSGAIKLVGPVNADHAKKHAEADALYLSTLVNSLFEQIRSNRGAE